MENVNCPICESKWGGSCRQLPVSSDGAAFDCTVCGNFQVTSEQLLTQLTASNQKLTPMVRAALSHVIRSNQEKGSLRTSIDSEWLEHFIDNAKLPNPAQQATNIIRFVGDQVSETGKPIPNAPDWFFSRVGSPNPEFAFTIASELADREILSGNVKLLGDKPVFMNVGLTLGGWEHYEAEKRGKVSGNYGFFALKFNVPELDELLKATIRPAIKKLGFQLLDMRDAAEPGIIDNIMREKIRDAAFILVDLSHDNNGAYWEAGFAEGLGKPVLYLCEQTKFQKASTHFDVNHCTTIIWGGTKTNEIFSEELSATLRNSLRLFPKS